MVRSQHLWCLFMLLGGGGWWSVTCAILGVALVFSLFSWAGLRFLYSFLLSTAGGLMCCVCSLSFVSVVWWSLCPVRCGFVYLSSIQGVSYLADRCSGAWPVWWLLHGTVMVKSLGIVVLWYPITYTNITDAEISPSWRIHSNTIKKYHYTFERKPDDGHLGRNM